MLIEKLKLTIRKLRHEQFGQSSERGALLDQLELQLADLEENAAQAETECVDRRNGRQPRCTFTKRIVAAPSVSPSFRSPCH